MSETHSLTELKESVLALTYTCPKGVHTGDCPFGMLKGLSHESRQNILRRMSRDELTGLFDLAGTCACPRDPRIGGGR